MSAGDSAGRGRGSTGSPGRGRWESLQIGAFRVPGIDRSCKGITRVPVRDATQAVLGQSQIIIVVFVSHISLSFWL